MKYLILFALCSFSFVPFSKGHYLIKIMEYKISIVPDNCKQSILETDKDNNRYFKILLKNCKGEMHLECYDLNDSTLMEAGNYIASLDLLKTYVYGVGMNGKTEIIVSKYYQPLRDGMWYYYDKNGTIVKTESYMRGVLLKK